MIRRQSGFERDPSSAYHKAGPSIAKRARGDFLPSHRPSPVRGLQFTFARLAAGVEGDIMKP